MTHTGTLLEPLALGFVIGLVLGGVGGGGAILTVPALVYLLDQPVPDATWGSLVIVGLGALAGLCRYARSRRVAYRAGAVVAVAGIPASILGSVLSPMVNPRALMIAFSALMLAAAVALVARSRGTLPRPSSAPAPLRPARSAAVGLGAGFLTGLLGAGGGFVLVPALAIALGMSMDLAAGTSLLIIVCNSAVAIAARLGSAQAQLDVAVVIPFTIAVMAASWAGRSLTERLRPATVATTFAGMLVVVAIWSAGQSI